MPIRKAIWNTDEQFNYGSPVFNNISVFGTGEEAYLGLTERPDNSDDIPFDIPSNYTYDIDEVLIEAGIAKLKASIQNEQNYPFTTLANYTYDSNKIEVVGGFAQLVGSPIETYAWYHLNESTGTNVSDSSGNGRDGTTQNMDDTNWVPGKLNNCLYFNGVDEYVDSNFSVLWERSQSITFEFWVKTIAIANQAIISNFAKPGGQYRGHEVFIDTSGFVTFYLFSSNLSRLGVRSTNAVNDGNWHHVVCTYDGTSLPSGIHIYIDNNDETLVILLNTLSSTTIVGSNFHIARRQDGTGLYFAGNLDEIVIYDFELSPSQALDRWNAGNGTELPLNSYDIGSPTIETNNGFAFTFNLGSFTETSIKPANTEIKYQISIDDGVTYKWWNGFSWINRTVSQFELVDSITIITGTFSSGDITSLQNVEGYLYVINEVTGTPGFNVEIGFSSMQTLPETVTIYGYYNGIVSHVVNVQIYNYNTTVWDTLGQIPHTASSVVVQYDFIIGGTSEDYIDEFGNSLVRIYHSSPGVAGHVLGLDSAEISGTPTTKNWYDEESNTSTEVHLNISELGSSGTLKVLSFLHSEDGLVTPRLDNLKIEEGVSYTTIPQEILMNFDIAPPIIFSWLTVTETVLKPVNTNILYQYSTDSGLSYNGIWLTAVQLEIALQNIINPEKVRIKFQLTTTDSSVTPEIDNLNITSETGFEESGYYESIKYYPENFDNGVFLKYIEHNIELLDGCSCLLEVRFVDNPLERGFLIYDNRDNINQGGDFIQWRISMSNGGLITPKLHYLEIQFHTLIGLLGLQTQKVKYE